jgi:hypothetical protein
MKQVVKASIKMKVTLCSPLGFACRRILIDSPFMNGLSMRLWAIHKHRQQVDYHDHNKNQKTRFFRESPEKTQAVGAIESYSQGSVASTVD